MEAFIGTILPWPGTFAPNGWAFCDGSLMQIRSNAALYSILGIQYGGDGQNTFALPDLRGRTVLGPNGQAPLTARPLAQKGGAETVAAAGTGNGTGVVTLTPANLPAHTHSATLSLSGLGATTDISVGTGTGGQLAATAGATLTSTSAGASGAAIYQASSVAPVSPVTLGGVKTTVSGTGSVTVDPAGGGAPAAVSVNVSVNTQVPTMTPFLVLNYIICLNGLYPSRN